MIQEFSYKLSLSISCDSAIEILNSIITLRFSLSMGAPKHLRVAPLSPHTPAEQKTFHGQQEGDHQPHLGTNDLPSLLDRYLLDQLGLVLRRPKHLDPKPGDARINSKC